MGLRKGYQALLQEALAEVETVPVEAAISAHRDPDIVFVDLRDVRELEREGVIPGAFHAPRGMLEFWVDPESPYHKPVFASGKRFLLFCAAGWRSALAAKTLGDMGLQKVAHINGGFSAWKAAGGPIGQKPSKEGT